MMDLEDETVRRAEMYDVYKTSLDSSPIKINEVILCIFSFVAAELGTLNAVSQVRHCSTSVFAAKTLTTVTTALTMVFTDVTVAALFLNCAWRSVRISRTCPVSHVLDNGKNLEPHRPLTSFPHGALG
eukprot:PhF_6_TR8344/c4_g5_i4/m.13060